MARRTSDWLEAFLDYTSSGEAPTHMYFWCGVSTIAATLQRRVYFDQSPNFIWYPNFYIILVADPGIVAKSSTADLGMQLLRDLPTVHFGASSTSWQKLVSSFEASVEKYIDPKRRKEYEMRCLTLNISELGTLIPPNDRQFIDMLTHLYDCKDIERDTHAHGEEKVHNPWLNLIGCTTPSWISENFPQYMIGGGLTSRTLWVYGERKRKFIAYPAFQEGSEARDLLRLDLIHDLREMTELVGEFNITREAVEWGEWWYEEHFTSDKKKLDDSNFKGYIQRKQGHIHKLAMVLAISRGDALTITKDDLVRAEVQVSALETSAGRIFSAMGKGKEANQSDRLIEYIANHGVVTIADAYEHVRGHFPRLNDFEAILKGLMRSGVLVAAVEKGVPGIKIGSRTGVAGGSSTLSQTSPNR